MTFWPKGSELAPKLGWGLWEGCFILGPKSLPSPGRQRPTDGVVVFINLRRHHPGCGARSLDDSHHSFTLPPLPPASSPSLQMDIRTYYYIS